MSNYLRIEIEDDVDIVTFDYLLTEDEWLSSRCTVHYNDYEIYFDEEESKWKRHEIVKESKKIKYLRVEFIWCGD
ncbi:hypothetical protein CW713_00560 [Methanophagales archaeon]|nr:MAG: hypothetical protein CW713_00560 [Methanophagales archaeon]